MWQVHPELGAQMGPRSSQGGQTAWKATPPQTRHPAVDSGTPWGASACSSSPSSSLATTLCLSAAFSFAGLSGTGRHRPEIHSPRTSDQSLIFSPDGSTSKNTKRGRCVVEPLFPGMLREQTVDRPGPRTDFGPDYSVIYRNKLPLMLA